MSDEGARQALVRLGEAIASLGPVFEFEKRVRLDERSIVAQEESHWIEEMLRCTAEDESHSTKEKP